MKIPEPIWKFVYSADRRNHHHRCKCCNKILKDGEQAFMTRVAWKKTYVIHEECGSKQHGTANWTYFDAMKYWGEDYLRSVGFKVEYSIIPE